MNKYFAFTLISSLSVDGRVKVMKYDPKKSTKAEIENGHDDIHVHSIG